MSTQREQPHMHLKPNYDAVCPSCGRFVGAYERCPYCQADMKMRMSLKLIRRISLYGALAGLVLLYFASRAHELPVIHVGEVEMNNNMALVKVVGTVVDVIEDQVKNNFKVTLDDGTGRITLNAFGKLDVFKREMGDSFPREGDRLQVVGNLNISDQWGVSMFLSTPRRVSLLEKATVMETDIAGVNDDMLARRIRFKAQVTEVRKFKSGYSLTLDDGTGTIGMTIFNQELEDLEGDPRQETLVTSGSMFSFQAKVDKYRDTLQVRLAGTEPGDAEYLGHQELAAAPGNDRMARITPLGDIPLTKEGAIVTIKVTTVNVKQIQGVGRSLTVHDNSGEEVMFIYSNMDSKIEGITRLDREKDVPITATVKLTTYRGKRQLVPVSGESVVIGDRGE
ncbi:hypothetical protein JW905_05850 [bacterium]|nr:hypothetical protein [candidate division CSSED10-310 bacterium]